MFGGPVGSLVLIKEDGSPLPFNIIESVYRQYDNNDEEGKGWYDMLESGITRFTHTDQQT